MIYTGIEIGMFFELNMDKTANCQNMFSVARPLLQMIFVFVQMYFIFLNQKMNIYKNKFMSRFELMHMIATNLCVWLNVLILETNHEILELQSHDKREAKVENITLDSESEEDNSIWKPHMFDLSHLISMCQRKNNIMSPLPQKPQSEKTE